MKALIYLPIYCLVALATLAVLFVGTGGAHAADKSSITFTKDVLPILQENCQDCHRPGGANLGGMVAPMAFITYEEVRPWAKAIAKNVTARDMPPWDASPATHGQFRNERTLTQEEIDTINTWVESGAPRGNRKDAPEPLDFPDAEWLIGQPDLVVTMPEPYFVKDDVEDLYETFYTTLTEEMLPEDRLIQAIEFKPGSAVVHHIISDPLGGIAPGNDPNVMPEGFYQKLAKGSSVSFQMHYHKEPGPGTGVWDQSSVGIKFYPKDANPEHQIRMAPLSNMDFTIPAGDPNYIATAQHTFDSDAIILGYTPHMHLRGKYAKYDARYPDGREEELLEVPQYDFNWQTTYYYDEPKIMPAGSQIDLTMAWDNSVENPYNPDPTIEVVFGEPTTAEMMFGFVYYAYAEEPDEFALSAEDLERYVGKYDMGNDRIMELVIEGGQLKVVMPGAPKFGLTPNSATQFEFDWAELIFNIQQNEAGEVTGVQIIQKGKDEGTVERIND